jgi:putative peptidoglycan lipid II flippase
MGRLIRSTGLVAASTLASRVLGLARDMLMAALFSANGATDAFYAAFRVPNLARRLVTEGVLTVTFIPVYTDYYMTRGSRDAMELAQKTMTTVLAAGAAAAATGVLFAPVLVPVLAMGFEDQAQIGRTVVMFRIMFPYVAVAGVLALCMGVLNSHRRFFAPAFAPVLLNVGIISGILLSGRFFADPLYAVSAGVMAGGVLQIILQIPFMVRAGFRMKLSLNIRHPELGRIFRNGFLGIAGMGIHQVNILVATLLGSYLADGSISYIYFSDRLHELVLGVTVISIGTVMLPEMSAQAARDDTVALIGSYRASVRSALFFAVPATAALMIIGLPIISVLLMHNRFTAVEAGMTFRALFYASAGIVGLALVRLTAPVFFTLGDARTPFAAAAVSFVVNATCGWALMRTPLRHAGLTLAAAIAATVQAALLVAFLGKKAGAIGMRGMLVSAAKNAAAAAFMGAVIWVLSGLIDWKSAPFTTRLCVLAGTVAAGGGAYFASSYALGVEEARMIATRVGLRK